MSVARHLKIDLAEYDRRIRSFIPQYSVMLDVVASTTALLHDRPRVVLDLGIGTGALSARCLARSPRASVHGIDTDPAILAVARRRLGRRWPGRVTLVAGDFARTPFPKCDAIVATLALHHVPTASAKLRLYRKCRAALRPGGVLVTGDCFPASDPALARKGMANWRAHMRMTYSASETRRYLAAWATEDTYFPLRQECSMLERAGFVADVVWREPPFGVLLARRP